MEEYIKLQKPLKETKYLSQENTYRYRPIMCFFFNKYELDEQMKTKFRSKRYY